MSSAHSEHHFHLNSSVGILLDVVFTDIGDIIVQTWN